MENDDIERLLEKRWKRYRAAQNRRKVASGVLLAAVRAAGVVATFLRRAHLLRQTRRERVAVE